MAPKARDKGEMKIMQMRPAMAPKIKGEKNPVAAIRPAFCPCFAPKAREM